MATDTTNTAAEMLRRLQAMTPAQILSHRTLQDAVRACAKGA